MNTVEDAARKSRDRLNKAIDSTAPFLAVVTGQSAGKVTIRDLRATTGATELYARLPGFALANDDVVVCIKVSGKPVVLGLAQKAAPTLYTLDAPLDVPALTIGGNPIDTGSAITVKDDNVEVDDDIVTLDFHAPLTVSESPATEVNIGVDVGTGSTQVAAGNHNHDSAYAAISHNHDASYLAIDAVPVQHVIYKAVNANPGLATATTVGMPAALLNATVANADDADGPWIQHTTGAVSGNATSMRSDALDTVFRRDWQPDVEFMFKAPATITSIRVWVGLFAAVPNAADDPTLHGAGFRFSTGASDANWQAWSNDNSGGGAIANTGVTFSANGVYRLRVQCRASDIRYFVNGSLVATHSTNLPTATVMMGYNISAATLTNASRAIKWQRVSIIHR